MGPLWSSGCNGFGIANGPLFTLLWLHWHLLTLTNYDMACVKYELLSQSHVMMVVGSSRGWLPHVIQVLKQLVYCNSIHKLVMKMSYYSYKILCTTVLRYKKQNMLSLILIYMHGYWHFAYIPTLLSSMCTLKLPATKWHHCLFYNMFTLSKWIP